MLNSNRKLIAQLIFSNCLTYLFATVHTIFFYREYDYFGNVLEYENDYFAFWTNVLEYEYNYSDNTRSTSIITQKVQGVRVQLLRKYKEYKYNYSENTRSTSMITQKVQGVQVRLLRKYKEYEYNYSESTRSTSTITQKIQGVRV